ncbi:MAG: TetR/AcrR family transcriptional regulator [Bacteroidota bacterium]
MKTKDIIIQKGMEILTDTGYFATSIQNIVKAAGIPKGSFYYYFESKDMFCLEIINFCADEINRKTELYQNENNSLDPKEYLKIIFTCKEGIILGKLIEELTPKNEFLFQALKLTIDQILKKIEEIFNQYAKKNAKDNLIQPAAITKFFFYSTLGLQNALKFHDKNNLEFDLIWEKII